MDEQSDDTDGKKAVQTRLEYEDYIEFNVAASREDLSKSALLRRLISDFLEEEREDEEGNVMEAMAD